MDRTPENPTPSASNPKRSPLRSWGLPLLLMFAVAAGLAVLLQGCGGGEDPWAKVPGGEPRVVVSFPPLYCFAKNVAGDDVAVLSLLTSVGPHDYKPANQDALAVRKARLYFANGLGLDDSLSKLINTAAGPSLTSVAVGNEGVPKDRRIHMGKVQHGDHWHPAGADPHVWLGIEEAISMVEVIRNELKKADPGRAAGYEERAGAYIKKLKKLHQDGKDLLEKAKNRNFVTNHDSLSYFARSFNLKIAGHIQTQPGVNVDARHLEELVKICQANKVRVIAVEPQYSKVSADLLRDGLKRQGVEVELVEIDPIETAEPAQLDAGLYERVMRKNLEALAKQLQ